MLFLSQVEEEDSTWEFDSLLQQIGQELQAEADELEKQGGSPAAGDETPAVDEISAVSTSSSKSAAVTGSSSGHTRNRAA